jgi:hypothetical protein
MLKHILRRPGHSSIIGRMFIQLLEYDNQQKTTANNALCFLKHKNTKQHELEKNDKNDGSYIDDFDDVALVVGVKRLPSVVMDK